MDNVRLRAHDEIVCALPHLAVFRIPSDNKYRAPKGLVKNSTAPTFVACTVIGTSPWRLPRTRLVSRATWVMTAHGKALVTDDLV
jgi:hypothetical protein